MKPILVACLIAAVASSVSDTNAQSDWFWQNPLPQGNLLNSVLFTDANTGTAVGEHGTVVRTTNGGATWTSQSSGTSTNLFGVSFTDANIGTAVGYYGEIQRTTNGGTTWNRQVSGTLHRPNLIREGSEATEVYGEEAGGSLQEERYVPVTEKQLSPNRFADFGGVLRLMLLYVSGLTMRSASFHSANGSLITLRNSLSRCRNLSFGEERSAISSCFPRNRFSSLV
jgi:hypothetical protein